MPEFLNYLSSWIWEEKNEKPDTNDFTKLDNSTEDNIDISEVSLKNNFLVKEKQFAKK